MTKLHKTATAFLLAAVMGVSGCAHGNSPARDLESTPSGGSSDINSTPAYSESSDFTSESMTDSLSEPQNNSTSSTYEDSTNNSDSTSDSDSGSEGSSVIEVYCPINEDSKFPYNLYIDVHQDSIWYIDLDEPLYGFERVIDKDALSFDARFSLKDDYKQRFDNYTFKVFSGDYSEDIASENLQSSESVFLSGLSLATGYKISFALRSDSLNLYYGGHFYVQAELNSTLSVDLFYALSSTEILSST
ncbi:MAG: hypothetical protein K2N56_05320 [Oscillospiraceae bacterium]|nr:hypothetical protein [Oscillospiraceae bacterium]